MTDNEQLPAYNARNDSIPSVASSIPASFRSEKTTNTIADNAPSEDTPAPSYNKYASLDDPQRFVSVFNFAITSAEPPKKKTFKDFLKPYAPPPDKPVIMMPESIYLKYFNYEHKTKKYLGTEPEFEGRRLLEEGKLALMRKEQEDGQAPSAAKNVSMATMGDDPGMAMHWSASGVCKYKIVDMRR